MEVSKRDFESLIDLFDKKYNNHILTANITPLFPPKKITENVFRNLVQLLKFSPDNGGFGLTYNSNTILKVELSGDDYKEQLLLFNQNDIKKLWLFDSIPNDMKMSQEEKGSSFGFVDYSIEIDEAIVKDVSPELVEKVNNDEIFKKFTYENQIEFLSEDGKHLFLFVEKQQANGKNLRSSLALLKDKEYEIRVVRDFIRFEKDEIEGEIESFLENLSFILGLTQDSTMVVSKPEISRVYTQYSLLAGKTMPISFKDYVGVEPVIMSRKNGRSSKEVINVLENYGVRYNIVGENCLLMVIENRDDSEMNGGLYLFSQNQHVRRLTGLVPEFGRSIFDVTYVAEKNTVVVNDCLFHNGKDMRTTHFVYPKGSKDNLSRIDVVLKFMKSVGMSKVADEEYDTKIIRNSVKFGSGPDIFEKSMELLNTYKEFPVYTDGLVYIPIRDHIPNKGGMWEALLVWKEPSDLTIPFMVQFDKNPDTGEDLRYPFTQSRPDGFLEVKQYKVLNLMVTGQKEAFNKMTHKYYKMKTAVSFEPTFPLIEGIDVNTVHKARIVVNDKEQAEIEPGVEITDGMIVEFAYMPELEGKSHLLWVPKKIRWDLMAVGYNESEYYGIEQRFANDFWRIIHYPLSWKMIRDKYVEEEPIQSGTSSYYSELDVRTRNLERMPYMNFHNWCIKSYLFNKSSPAIINKNGGQKGALIDFASGRGADLGRYKSSRFKTVLGVEIVKESVDHAVGRYKKMPRPKPNVHFAWGDADKLLFPKNESAFDATGRLVMSKVLLNKYGFDAATVMFAIHYFFENEMTLRTFLQNVTDTLKIGGIFFGTTFDGAKVFNLLKENKGKVSKFYKGDPFFTIEKAYTDRVFNPDKPNLGKKIYVKIESIGIAHPEYLVNFDFFIKMAKEYGLEVVEIKNFGTYFSELEESNDPQCANFSGMSEEEKIFSFLNNMFIFRKVQNASDAVFQRLMDLRKKEGKKVVMAEMKQVEYDEATGEGYSAGIVEEEIEEGERDDEYEKEVETFNEKEEETDKVEEEDEEMMTRQDEAFDTELDETFPNTMEEAKEESIKSINIPDNGSMVNKEDTVEDESSINADATIDNEPSSINDSSTIDNEPSVAQSESSNNSKKIKMKIVRKKDKVGGSSKKDDASVSSRRSIKKNKSSNIKSIYLNIPDNQMGGNPIENPTKDQSRPYLADYGHFQVDEVPTPADSNDPNVKTIIIS